MMVRTEKLNKLILLTWSFVGQHKGSKIEKESNFCSLSPMVAPPIQISNELLEDTRVLAQIWDLYSSALT